MPTLEQLEQAREKARLSPYVGKRGKGKKTLEIEELRRIFKLKVSEFWNEILDAQIRDALKDRQAREYVINQVIGRAKERQELEIQPRDITDEIADMQ